MTRALPLAAPSVTNEVIPMTQDQLDIAALAEARMAAGIADPAEAELYRRGDLVAGEYSDEFKQALLHELERSIAATGQPRNHDYGFLLACTNEVVRLLLVLRVEIYKGEPCIRIYAAHLVEARARLAEHDADYVALFGAAQVEAARALLTGLAWDLGDLPAVTYRR